ncbi:MAG: hypothetical protein AAFX06_26835 [Planctomycetota bacterium]
MSHGDTLEGQPEETVTRVNLEILVPWSDDLEAEISNALSHLQIRVNGVYQHDQVYGPPSTRVGLDSSGNLIALGQGSYEPYSDLQAAANQEIWEVDDLPE